MRKKLSVISAFLVMTTVLSGCTLKSNYKEDDYDIVATYIAHSVLEHDRNLAYRLVDLPEDEEEEENPAEQDEIINEEPDIEDNKDDKKNEEEASEPEDQDGEDDIAQVELSTVLGVEGVKCEYSSYKMVKSIGNKNAYSLDASKNNTLCVVTIKMTNSSEENKKLSLTPNGITYKLVADDNVSLPLMTGLNNDILYYEGTIGAGKSKNAVVVFDLPDVDYKTIKISISSDKGEYDYTMK